MTKYYQNIGLWLLLSLLITACSKDGADGNDVTNPNEQTSEEIRFNADVWKMAEATRATILNNTYLITNGFICTAYTANSSTANGDVNIENNHVTWNGSRWVFDGGSRNWPASGDLDFFTYTPTTIPTYITNNSDVASSITYAARNPQFKCANLPVTNSGQDAITEFVYALTTGQNKTNAASGVTLSFLHPFTRIQLQLVANHPAIRINTITFKSIKNNGTYNNASWSPSGETTDFVWTFNGDYDNHASNTPLALGNSYLVIPQTWAGTIEVNATWNVWGESQTKTVSTTLGSVTWLRGNSYTYTFTITPTDLVVNTSKYTEQW